MKNAPNFQNLQVEDLISDYYKSLKIKDFIDFIIIDNVEYHLYEGNIAIVEGYYKNFSPKLKSVEHLDVIEIPNIIDGFYQVIGISDEVFMDRIDLKKVILPNTLKFIGKKAFYHCDNLEEIVVGDSIKVIGKEAFGNCLNLKKVMIRGYSFILGSKIFEASHKVNIYLKIHEEPDNWASNWNVENSPVIYNYYKDVEINQIIYALTKDFKAYVAGHKIETHRNLILPSEFKSEDLDFISRSFSVVEILRYAFYDASYLDEIHLPDSIDKIHDFSFSKSHIKKIKLPSKLSYLGEGTFKDCSQLVELDIPQGIKTIEKALAYNCIALKKVKLTLFDINRIEDHAFNNCKSLVNFEIPISVNHIGDYAIANTNLASIRLGYNIKWIGEGAFEDNYNLSTLVILNNDCFIKREIINTYETTQIYLYGNEDSITEQFLRKFANGKVKIKPESYKIYEEFGVYYLIHYYDAGIVVGYNDDWITEEVHILDKIGPCVINHIEERAFYGASKIKKLHMPNSIVMLGNSFLDETLNLEEVYIDENSKILNKLQKIIKEPVKLVLK